MSGHTFLHQNHWIHGAVVYGKAARAHTPEVRHETDALLGLVTQRLVHSMHGKRFIMGDFNQEPGLLEHPKQWHALGWREVQIIHQQCTGQEPRPTCHHKTIKDFVWLSPELAPFFKELVYMPSIFPDHTVIGAVLMPFGPPEPIPIWRHPKPLTSVGTLPDEGFCGDPTMPLQQACTELARQYEERVHQSCAQQGKPLPLPTQKGRATTFRPTFVPAYTQPAKPGRSGSFQVEYGGISLRYNRWVKQLRRLESMSHASNNKKDGIAKQ